MSMTVLLICLAIAAVFSMTLLQKLKAAKAEETRLFKQLENQQAKLRTSQNDAQKLRDNLSKKTNNLNETKNLLKKKSKKQGQNEQPVVAASAGESITGNLDFGNTANSEVDGLKSALKTLQEELSSARRDASGELKSALGTAEKDSREKILQLESTVKKLRLQNDTLEGKAKTALLKSGEKIDLDALSPVVLNELARLHRKAQQNERLHAMVQGKLQMSGEKFQELQRKFFSVCRELALTTGSNEVVEEKALGEKIATEPIEVAVKPEVVAEKAEEAPASAAA